MHRSFRLAALVSASLLRAPASQVTFDDIAPILAQQCAACHHPGGSGPFSLVTYNDARKRAGQISKVTASRYMPPWLPEPGYGRFADELRLTDDQIRQIEEWAAGGAPEGNPHALPPSPDYSENWKLGKPDMVLTLPRPYMLSAAGDNGRDVFRNFVLPVPVKSPRYVRAIERFRVILAPARDGSAESWL